MKKVISLFCLLFILLPFAFTQPKKIIVAQDGSGDYKTVQEAINAVKDSNAAVTTIYIKNGVYKEKLRLPASKCNVHFIGDHVEKTILTYDDYASKKDSTGKDIGTSGSASFFIFGDGFTAENITFENSSGPVGQAVAVRVTGDKAKFINCRFLGFQDTLYTHTGIAAGNIITNATLKAPLILFSVRQRHCLKTALCSVNNMGIIQLPPLAKEKSLVTCF